jgi:hypothetical protein
MPTILNYLNYDSAYIAFGNNLLDDSKESFGFNTFGSTYYLFMRDHVLEMIDNRSAALYDYKKDRFQKTNLIGLEPRLQEQMENKLKAIIQTYNQRLIDDDLTVK